MDRLIDPAARPEKIAGGFGFTEGPVFSRRGYLLFSDMGPKRIMKWEKGVVTVFRENSNTSNGLTFDHQGRLLACERDRVTRTEKNGSITVLAKGMQWPNDLVYAIDGSIYFSDLPAGAVYQITCQGAVRVVSRDCEKPNGVALAPNQQKLYVADSGQHNIRVYDIAGDGALRNGRIFAQANPDGLKTDEDGNVWVAGERDIVVFDALGKRLGTIAFPEVTSNCNWGDGFRTLYVTAQTSVYRIRSKVNGARTY